MTFYVLPYDRLPAPITPGPRLVPPPGALLVPLPIGPGPGPRAFAGSKTGARLDNADDIDVEEFMFDGDVGAANAPFVCWRVGEVMTCSLGGDTDDSELRRRSDEVVVDEAVVFGAGVEDDEEFGGMGDAGALPNDPDFRDPRREGLARMVGGDMGKRESCCWYEVKFDAGG